MSGTVPPPPPPPPGHVPGPEGTPEPGVPPRVQRVPSAHRMPPSFSPSGGTAPPAPPAPPASTASTASYGQPAPVQPHAYGQHGYGQEAYAPPQPQVPPGGYAAGPAYGAAGPAYAEAPAAHPAAPPAPPGPGGPGGGRSRRGRLTPGWIAFIAVDALLLVVAVVFAVQVFGGGSPGTHEAGAGPGAQAGQESGEQDGAGDDGSDGPAEAEVLAQFASPSRNITCEITTAGASCGIAELDKQPAPVEGCDGTTGYVVALDGDGRVSLPCVPSSEQPEKASEDADVLEYGESITEGDYTCSSAETGMSCTYDPSGRGFSLARAGIGTF